MNNVVGLALRGLIGAVLGGIIGYTVYVWLAGQGLLAVALPGAMIGLGCTVLLQRSSAVAGVLCALAALPLGILCEWRTGWFREDDSLRYFITHLHQLDRPAVTWTMIALGAVFAFWLGKGSDAYHTQRPDASADK